MLTAEPILRVSGLSLVKFKAKVGISSATLKKARKGPITVLQADVWCRRLGHHPAEVYGLQTWLDALRRSATC